MRRAKVAEHVRGWWVADDERLLSCTTQAAVEGNLLAGQRQEGHRPARDRALQSGHVSLRHVPTGWVLPRPAVRALLGTTDSFLNDHGRHLPGLVGGSWVLQYWPFPAATFWRKVHFHATVPTKRFLHKLVVGVRVRKSFDQLQGIFMTFPADEFPHHLVTQTPLGQLLCAIEELCIRNLVPEPRLRDGDFLEGFVP
jgi:hypothetical protein